MDKDLEDLRLMANPLHLQINVIKNEKDTINFNDVLKIKPDYQPALRNKALVLFYLKKPDQGLSYIKESVRQNPKDYIALNTYGLISMSMKLFKEAEKVFKIAIDLKPDYFPSYNNLGRNYYIIKNRKKALYNFKKAHEINPDFQEAINNIADTFRLGGRVAITSDGPKGPIHIAKPKSIATAIAIIY